MAFAFTGKQYEEATALQHNLFRWYDPTLGQWLSEDPLSFAAGDENVRRYVRNDTILRLDPLGLYNQDEIDQMWVFFNTCAGMYAEFGYLDPYDNAATAMPFGTGNGSATQFQLTRTTTAGGLSFTEPLFAFVGTPVIYRNGVATTAFTISNGLVTFTTAPANGVALTWTGQYMFLCRFEEDSISPKQMMSQFWSLDGVAFKSVKKP
jgi:RHS repeat-associated protein